jgi:predicted metal-dependent hydrolase
VQLSLPLSGTTAPARDVVMFVRHRRARRYILRVLHDGSLRVTVPRWGAKREAHAFVEANRGWIERQRALLRFNRREAPALDAAAEAALRKRAQRELPQQLLALAAEHGITVRHISIRNQRTRWGACSPSGTITLNWRLVQTPDFVREYVLIHELMHRRELNHSRRFWRHVAAACPRMAEARAWLKHEGKMLWSDAD